MPGSSVARIVRLAMHGLLVVVASLPGLVFADQASQPSAPAEVFSTAPAAAAPATAPAAPAARAAQLTRAGTSSGSVMPGLLPPRFGLVQPTPMASWIPNGQVNALATDGTYVYLGGSFTAMTDPKTGSSQPHAGLARVNLTSGVSDSTWNPSVTGTTVDALALRTSTSTLYVGGLFTSVDGQARSNFATVSTTGSGALGPMDPAPDDEVHALLLDGTKLVLGGVFTTVTGAGQHRLARLDATTGALDAGFAPNVSGGAVLAITRPPGTNVYAIGGGFSLIGGATHNFIGQVNATTGAANSWAPSICPLGTKCQALSLASDGTQVYAAIAGPGGQTAAYDVTSGQRRWVVASDGNAQAVALFGSELYVGGHFNTSFGGQLRRTLAAVDPRTGALDPNFRPSATSTFPGTEALLATPVGIVAGGAQLSIGGTAQSRLAIFPAKPTASPVRLVGAGRGSGPLLPR